MEPSLDYSSEMVSDGDYDLLDEVNEKPAHEGWERRSFIIAVRILREIRAQKEINGMTQKRLAEAMGVTPQYLNKVVKGKENLTLGTIDKMEQVLGITLIEVPSSDDRRSARSKIE